MRQTTRMLTASVVAATLLLGACGRSSSGGGSKIGSDSGSGGTLASGDFGTMKHVCGKGTGKNNATATARGVTANSIDVGVIADVGFVGAPGFSQELWDASDVFVKWCNAAGGINGRMLKDTHLDSAITQYKQKVEVACQNEFALVGGGGAFDDAGQTDRLKCMLPAFPGFLSSAVARDSDLQWQGIPTPLNQVNRGIEAYLTETFPGSKGKIGYLSSSMAVGIFQKLQVEEAFHSLGWTGSSPYDEHYNAAGEATWVPYATQMRSKGVKGLVWVGESSMLAKLEQAMSAVNYKPDWVLGLDVVYSPALIKAAGSDLAPTYVRMSTTPFEAAGQANANGVAMKQYLDLFAKYLPSGRSHAQLGLQAFSSWLLFAKAAGACGADLTRRCVYDQVHKITSFDSGGLGPVVNPATGSVPSCYVAVQATSTGFKIVDSKPNAGVFTCDPSYVLETKGNYGKGYKLADVGKSLADLK